MKSILTAALVILAMALPASATERASIRCMASGPACVYGFYTGAPAAWDLLHSFGLSRITLADLETKLAQVQMLYDNMGVSAEPQSLRPVIMVVFSTQLESTIHFHGGLVNPQQTGADTSFPVAWTIEVGPSYPIQPNAR